MSKLGAQLFGIMITGQVIRIAKEHILGQILSEIRMAKARKRDKELVASVVAELEVKSPGAAGLGARWRTLHDHVNIHHSARAAFGERR